MTDDTPRRRPRARSPSYGAAKLPRTPSPAAFLFFLSGWCLGVFLGVFFLFGSFGVWVFLLNILKVDGFFLISLFVAVFLLRCYMKSLVFLLEFLFVIAVAFGSSESLNGVAVRCCLMLSGKCWLYQITSVEK